MVSNRKPVVFDEDNPEWTKEDFARARPASEFPELAAAFPKMKTGRPRKAEGERKVAVSLRLSPAVVDYFKSQGPGWQTRIDQELTQVMKGRDPRTGEIKGGTKRRAKPAKLKA